MVIVILLGIVVIMKTCPFKIFQLNAGMGRCRLQVQNIQKLAYTFDGEDVPSIIYCSCVGEDKCPIMRK